MEEYHGLSQSQVLQRQQAGQSNITTAKSGKTEKQIILEHCLTYFNLVFAVLAVILLLCGSSIKNMTFLVIVLINTVIGIVQQLRAKRAVDKLTLVTAQQVQTLRDGQWTPVRSDLLVLDDVVRFGPGDQICADAVVLRGSVQVNESLLTGEADAVEKQPGSQLLSGSFVVSGRGVAQLTQVGDNAFAAKLAREAKADPRAAKSEMMRALDKLIWVMGMILIPVGLMLFYQEFKILQLGVQTSAEATVAALVGMIPEGLYLLTSVAMAVSALKLTKAQVLVQDMNCIEALARVDVLCVDKTGTITEPAMIAEHVLPLDGCDYDYLEQLLTALYGSREPDNDTARAISELFCGQSTWNCTAYIPFDSKYKYSGGVFEDRGSFLVGAPEILMGQYFEELQSTVTQWSSKGYRVLLVARYDRLPQPDRPEKPQPLALILLTNRIRQTAPETFGFFKQQGVTVKVISGDNPVTVSEVANRAGIPDAEAFVDAGTLQTPEQISHAAAEYTVFGRVTPEIKKQLIFALKQQGHTVAMTGDGVNDVLAMRQADCGVAMASGARAASQVAQLVLTQSDFAAMPQIVNEGRRVINNIQRAASLFLVKNIFSLCLALVCLFTGWAYPFMPFHLSVISALTIGVPGFFLAMEPNYERVRGKFLPTVLRQALPGGLTDLIVVLITHVMMISFQLPMGDSATVCTAVLALVGLMVLYKVSVPFDLFRKLIWGAMAIALLGSFTLLGAPFELTISDSRSYLVLLSALIMAPTVFYALQRLFEQWDRLWSFLKSKLKKK
ncbi:MAG: cation-translocating P-type ATPase [Oscillospiraceae bacterium]|nr:cation-translocating P-type ATPase [Oscillospiraceae bacterium]